MRWFSEGMPMEQTINRCKGFLRTIEGQIISEEFPVDIILWKKIGYNQRDVILEDTSKPGWEPFTNGSRFGGKDIHACFRTVFSVKEEHEGREIRFLLRTGMTDIWNTDNPQFLIYVNGEIACGMDMNHYDLCLTKSAVPGENYDIGIYAYSNSEAASDYLRVVFGEKKDFVEKFYYDFKVMLDACMLKKPDDKDCIDMLDILNRAINMTNLVNVPGDAFYESVKNADKFLCDEFYDKLSEDGHIVVHSIGHTHIDVAWKWPVRQTREKAIRSFSTVLKLMEEYPEYRFMSSQPQLYKFVKEDAPEVYEKIKERVKEGRWETEGAMWLEADCNLTSGESLVRQILKGEEFFQREFGTGDNRVLWLPDVFGYSAAIPQIMKKCGLKYFMTTKIAWNELNRMPHDLMLWRGIDGTEVLCYFITCADYKLYPELQVRPRHETTYTGRQNVNQVMGTWQRFTDKDLTDEVLECYGFGDGGGGPTAQMLEESRRMEKGIPGVPVTKQTFAREYFELLEEKIKGKKLPKWDGELYLEYHRGTYTSIGKNKKNNRKAEFLNNEAEALSLFACLVDDTAAYPSAKLDRNWELTLLNQFHDILPGSSLKEVYDTTDEEYEEIFATDGEIINSATEKITGKGGENMAVYNMLSFKRDAIIETPNGPLLVADIPAMGYRVIDGTLCPKAEPSFAYDAAQRILQTPFYQVVFNEKGEISELYDKDACRNAVKPGEVFNKLIAFEDRPWEYDCWNIDVYYAEKPMELETVSVTELENTNERFTLAVKRKFDRSEINQRVSFYRSSRRIDFNTHIDWKQSQILLKAAFPVDVVTNKCTCDIQFGNVERPTHNNTSWDEAKFEVCSHKWIDVSEADYGVAVLNDCKYGADINESTVRLTLLKSGIFPNPEADRGEHEFVYSILPHTGDFRDANVDAEGYALNLPVTVKSTSLPAGSEDSMFSVDVPGVFADAFKLAENKNGMILRIHEAFGRRTKVSIDLKRLNVRSVIPCDLLEREIASEDVSFSGGIMTTCIKPYEILTFRLV